MAPAVERKALESWYGKIGAYLREMGISQDLLAAAREIEYSRLRFLTRDQIVAFGIDRRETVEGMWWFVDQTLRPERPQDHRGEPRRGVSQGHPAPDLPQRLHAAAAIRP